MTGSGGHVGGAIADELTSSGHEVIGLGRRLTKRNRRLAGALVADIGHVGAAESLASRQPRCDAIVHAAAALDKDNESPAITLTNALGTQQMLALARAWDVASFVYISGVTVIGMPQRLPIDETHPTAPLTAYHASKLFGEHLAAIAHHGGLPAVSLRLTAPVGPETPPGRILSVFVQRALAGEPLELAGQGERRQDYVDVRDVAAAVQTCVTQSATGLMNVGAGTSTSNLELARSCVEQLGSSSDIRLSGKPDPEEDRRWEVSIAHAQASIGYRPRHRLADSIAAVAEDLRGGGA